MSKTKSNYISQAICLAESCLSDPKRAPFGSIIVKDNRIIGEGKEATRVNCDPTAHSEIEAIRDACKNLGTSNLKGCIMYTSNEPCSMCMSALHWAKIDAVYYASSREDVFKFGLPDRFKLVEKRSNSDKVDMDVMKLFHLKNEKAIKLFKKWRLNIDTNKME